MKKYFLSLLLLTAFVCRAEEMLPLQEIQEKNGIIKAKWSPFQLALVPEPYGQLISANAKIYGLAIGVFLLAQESATLSVGLTSEQHENIGLQCAVVTLLNRNYGLDIGALIGFVKRNHGFQIGAANVEYDGQAHVKEPKKGFSGVQIGAFNVGHGFQIGAINYNPDAWIPVLPLINFPK